MKRVIVFLCLLIFILSGSLSAATKTKKKAVKKTVPESTSAEKLYADAVKLHNEKNYTKAIDAYDSAIKADKNLIKAWLGLGICYYETKKNSNARLIFKYVLSIDPKEITAQKYSNLLYEPEIVDMRGKKKVNMQKGDMMWRSALLPGLGQFYNSEHAKGYLYTAGYLTSAAFIIKQVIDQQTAVAAYENATSDFDRKYKEAETAGIMVFVPVGAAVIVMAASVIDSFITGAEGQSAGQKAGIYMRDNETAALNIFESRF